MRILTTCIIILFLNAMLIGQNATEQKQRNGIYGELVTVPFFIIPVPKGLVFGYEHHFSNRNNLRVGLEYKNLDGHYYTLHTRYNFLVGKTKHFFEIGPISQFGFYENKTRTFSGELFKVETIFMRLGINMGYLLKFGKEKDLLFRTSINFLSRDLHLHVLRNDFINEPGEGDQLIQPHPYFGITKLF